MGQKVNPKGFRVGPTLNYNWDSVFYARGADYKTKLQQDIQIRDLAKKFERQAKVSNLKIKRNNTDVIVDIYAFKPGYIIGKSGADIEKLKKKIEQITNLQVFINIHEVKKPNIEATIIAQTIASQLENRGSFRRAMKLAMQNCLKTHGAQGIKVACSGRLGGAEIARTEWYREGRVPLHTLRSDIDYSHAEALTTYGIIGIKVWVYKGDMK